jgi:hypothetical protein
MEMKAEEEQEHRMLVERLMVENKALRSEVRLYSNIDFF